MMHINSPPIYRKYKNNGIQLNREILYWGLFVLMVCFYFLVLIIPTLAIFKEVGLKNFSEVLRNSENAQAIKLSISTATISTFFVFLLGTPVVFMLTFKSSLITKILDVMVNITVVMPPAVVGIGLLFAYGRNGIIGHLLAKYGIEIVFTPAAVVLAQFFVSSAFYIQVLKASVNEINREFFEVSYLFGLGKVETFIRVIAPMLKKPMVTGLILSFNRALGEFGATIMFAGNVIDKTRVIPLQIYTLMQVDIYAAVALSLLLFISTFIMLLLIKIWLRE
ncbi:NifC-like ABC-type porter [Ruminiclostridium cellulolyticum H10]|uniref:NifC-like ABC-type porter n=2 Tax=Ruminiclostridium cellulolyticum TaxID=1521 RepID=B8I2F8_RUMCH|nr:NifC-like ABC-type porter [Ruminiclostridium cellulolyticum H10]